MKQRYMITREIDELYDLIGNGEFQAKDLPSHISCNFRKWLSNGVISVVKKNTRDISNTYTLSLDTLRLIQGQRIFQDKSNQEKYRSGEISKTEFCALTGLSHQTFSRMLSAFDNDSGLTDI